MEREVRGGTSTSFLIGPCRGKARRRGTESHRRTQGLPGAWSRPARSTSPPNKNQKAQGGNPQAFRHVTALSREPYRACLLLVHRGERLGRTRRLGRCGTLVGLSTLDDHVQRLVRRDARAGRDESGWGFAVVLGAIATVAACSATPTRTVFDDPAVDSGLLIDSAPAPGEEAGSLFVDAAPPEDLTPKGKWTGKVVTPAGDIPIAGALVYLTQKKPDPIPTGNFCDACVALEKTVPQTLTKFDGTFELTANRLGKQFVVIQKGQFRRVVEIEVKLGDVAMSKSDTILPTRSNTSTGDTVPSILVLDTNYDDIEETLGRLGVGTIEKADQATRLALLKDPARLAKYQIIFLPCGTCATRGGIFPANDDALDATVQKNLKEWVQKGGKLYVTDFAYSFINETWKDYVTFAPNRGCESDDYDTPANIQDPGLKEWLDGQNDKTFTFENAWIKIDRVNEVTVPDATGGTKRIVPKVWASGLDAGRNRPMTVSFEDRCGRVLYSAYHTEGSAGGSGGGLLPQEKALMYVLFEMSTCLIDPVIPK